MFYIFVEFFNFRKEQFTADSKSKCVIVLRNTRKSIVKFSNEHNQKRSVYRNNILQYIFFIQKSFLLLLSFFSFSFFFFSSPFFFERRSNRFVYHHHIFLWHGCFFSVTIDRSDYKTESSSFGIVIFLKISVHNLKIVQKEIIVSQI